MIKDFECPGVQYRILPFWFWNSNMEKSEIKHQILELKDKGLGGFFICPRQGLELAYLSEEWFLMCRYACELAKEVGLQVWIYDEYPYPSGMAGGEVLLKHPDAKHTELVTIKKNVTKGERLDLLFEFDEVLCCKLIPLDNNNNLLFENSIDISNFVGNIQPIQVYQKTGLTQYNNKRYFTFGPEKALSYTVPNDYSKYLLIIIRQHELKNFKYFGSYVDACNEDATKTFIEITHEKYKKSLGNMFSSVIKGFFSDEVSLMSKPWSKKLPNAFLNEHGYDILPHIQAVSMENYPNARKIRYDLYQTTHKLFRANYHKRIHDWCEENNLKYTAEVPSMRGTTQLYSHIVGGDCCHEKLNKSLDSILSNDLLSYRANPKFISSLTRQLNQNVCLVEAFHSIGWTFTLQDAKWQLDRLAIFGINLFNIHAFYYTIEGIKKHDAPPSQFLQNPYWKHYKLLSDYAARLSSFVTNTEAITKIAILDPVTSFWTRLGNTNHITNYIGDSEQEKAELEMLKNDYVDLCKELIYSHIDFDYLDPEMLENAAIIDGKICIGKGEYDTVVIPPITNLESLAIEKLKRFKFQGGKILGIGRLCNEEINEKYNSEIEMLNLFELKNTNAYEYFEKIGDVSEVQNQNVCYIYSPSGIKQSGALDILIHKLGNENLFYLNYPNKHKGSLIMSVRQTPQTDYAMIQNHQDSCFDAELLYFNENPNLHVYTCNLEDGKYYEIEHIYKDGIYKVQLNFVEHQSRLIGIGQNNEMIPIRNDKEKLYTIDLSEKMEVTISGQNCIRLEEFQLSIENTQFESIMVQPFIEILDKLSPQILPLNFTSSFGTPKEIKIDYPIRVTYTIDFYAEHIPPNLSLMFDEKSILGEYEVEINGNIIVKYEKCNITDFKNQFARIAEFTKYGKNKISISVTLHEDWHGVVDVLYLVGDFGVTKNDGIHTITKMPEIAIPDKDFIDGYPYYSGEMVFTEKIEISEFEKYDIVKFTLSKKLYQCVEVILNGISLGVRAFSPYDYQCKSSLLVNGVNTIQIKVTNTLSNMLDGCTFDYQNHCLKSYNN